MNKLNKVQAIYLAESGNNRGMARLNVKSLPEVDIDELLGKEEAVEDEESFDESFDEEALADLADDEDLEDSEGDEPEVEFLASIPRYINFYHKNPYFVNIDTGERISEGQYYALIQAQKQRLRKLKEDTAGQAEKTEIPIEDIYFPLPEVNVKKIGSIPIEKGIHLKPGFRIVLAERIPIYLKQKSIIEEYLNYVPDYQEPRARAVLRAISPNVGTPGQDLDVYFDGENLDGVLPQFSSTDITLIEYGRNSTNISIKEKAKPGRYNLRLGAAKTEFYIVPLATKAISPNIVNVTMPGSFGAGAQFTKISSKEKISGIKIIGEDFKIGNQPPIVVPDAQGVLIDVVSFNEKEIVINIETNKANLGLHYLTIYTEGGASNNWTFTIEKIEAEDAQEDPYTGTYTTVLTLLEANSLSNLPLKSEIETANSGRPSSATASAPKRPSSSSGGTGRPGDTQNQSPRSFDLLKSDLETVWRLETIATVNKISFKETKIIRRTAPKVGAAITTNTDLSFGQSSIVIGGQLQGLVRLEDSYSAGDLEVFVEGAKTEDEIFKSREDETNRPALTPSGNAVIEQLGFGVKTDSLQAKGFTPGAIVVISSSRGGRVNNDFAILESLSSNSVKVRDPGFQDSHFIGDELTQFIPAVITPDEVSDREAQKHLDPPSGFIDLPGRNSFEYVFNTRLDKMINWSSGKTSDTSVPSDLYAHYDGYFGLNIIEGTPSYTGANALYGQGALIIDTTKGGEDPAGGTVVIGGSSKSPSVFDGVIYIIGNLQISGPTEVTGGIVVNAPDGDSTMRIGGSGNITYNIKSIGKAILHLPFTEQLNSRILEKSQGQKELLKK